jgi:hypothetical protein
MTLHRAHEFERYSIGSLSGVRCSICGYSVLGRDALARAESGEVLCKKKEPDPKP